MLAFFESTMNVKSGWDVVTGTQAAWATRNVPVLSAHDPPGAAEDPSGAL